MYIVHKAVNDSLFYDVREAYRSSSWDTVQQERKGYYEREFKDDRPEIPGADEIYTAHFCRSNYLEGSQTVLTAVRNYILPTIIKHIPEASEYIKTELRAYKLIEGGHFRIHRDDYRAGIGFIWHLSSSWKWDWGGLLLTINPDGCASVEIPEPNKLVILNHTNTQQAHCVTPVTRAALEPRQMLVGFLSKGVN